MDASRATELALLATAAAVALFLALPYLSPILAAILLAYLLGVPHRWLSAYVGTRPAAVALIFGTVALVLVPFVLLFTVVATGVADLLEVLRGDLQRVGDAELTGFLTSLFEAEPLGGTSVRELLRNVDLAALFPTLMDTLGGVSAAVVDLTIVLFVLFSLLTGYDRLVSWLAAVVPLESSVRSELFDRADDLLYAVLVGQVVVAIVDGALVGLGLLLTGFADVLFWTILSMFLGLIPLVGTTVVWVPASAYLALTGSVPAGVLLFLYGLVVIGAVDNALRSLIGASEAGLSPALFLLGIFGGFGLVGPVGLFFGPIALGMAKIVFETFELDRDAPAG